jgi:hypothetical protein
MVAARMTVLRRIGSDVAASVLRTAIESGDRHPALAVR